MIRLDDAALAARLAEQAADLLLGLRKDLGHSDPAALRHAGDRGSHELLMSQFARHRPGDAVLSEEGVRSSAADKFRLSSDRVWIVDPLDGTREYGEEGRTDWAVHVALWQRGPGLTVAAVALPAQGTVLSTGLGADPGTGLGTAAPAADPGGPVRIAVSRTRPPGFVAELAGELGAELVPMGSAGAKACAVVQGTVDAYVHAGGQYEWDSAAPVAVALATGHFASRLDGSILEYNQPDASLPDLVVCRRRLAPRLLAAIRAILKS